MEPIIVHPLLHVALLGFQLISGGPPMLVAQAAMIIAMDQSHPSRTAQATPLPDVPDPLPPAAVPLVPAIPAPGAAAAGQQKLAGLAAWSALVGNSVAGKSDDDDLVEYYAKNGTVKQRVGVETNTGKWAVKGQKVCFDYGNDEDEACYTVKVQGSKATFSDEDGNVSVYTILPGNAKKL